MIEQQLLDDDVDDKIEINIEIIEYENDDAKYNLERVDELVTDENDVIDADIEYDDDEVVGIMIENDDIDDVDIDDDEGELLQIHLEVDENDTIDDDIDDFGIIEKLLLELRERDDEEGDDEIEHEGIDEVEGLNCVIKLEQ